MPASVQPTRFIKPEKRRTDTKPQLDAETLAGLRQALVQQRDAQIARLASIDGSAYLSHQEAGDEDMVRAQLDGLRTLLEEMESALERIEEGTYGACVRCSGAIAEARLQARPHARHCVPCQQHLDARNAR